MIDGDRRRLGWGSKHTTKFTGDALEDCRAETYIISLTHVAPINLT